MDCTHNNKLMVFVLKSNCSLKWRVNKSNTNLKYSPCFCRCVFMFYIISDYEVLKTVALYRGVAFHQLRLTDERRMDLYSVLPTVK